MIFVYVIANMAVIVYYRVRPGTSSTGCSTSYSRWAPAWLIYSVYKAFYPLPVHPNNWSPFIAGGWLIAGVVILLVMRARGKEAWLKKAGDVIGERIETPEEVALQHPHAL